MSNKAWYFLLSLSFIWGGSFYFIGEGVKLVPPLTLVWYRIFFAGLTLYLVIWWTRGVLPKQLEFWIKVSIMAGLNNIVPFTLIAWGQKTISGGLAAILNSNTAFAAVFIAAVFVSSEKLDIRRVIGTLVGILGVILVIGLDVLNEITLTSLSQLAVLLASVSYALASVWGQTQLSVYEPKEIACGTLLVGSVIIAPFVLFVDGVPELTVFKLKLILIIFGLSIVGTALAYVVYFRILELAGASNLMLVTVIVPVFAILIDAVLLGKWISMQTFAGFVVISFGLLLIDGRIFWTIAKKLKPK